MGIGISCKSGLNLHLGDLLTNYATNKFDSKRRKKEALNQLTKTKSESSFSIVSTKSSENLNENFNSRRRKREQLDEHQASQVIVLNLPNNEILFIEKLNCDLCQKQFLDEDGVNKEQVPIKNKFKKILDDTIENNLNEELEYDENEIDDDNCSITTIINTSLTKLDNQDLDFIDNCIQDDIKNDYSLDNQIKRLSSIEEEDQNLKDVIKEQNDDNEIIIDKKDQIPKKSSVKVQMSNKFGSPNSTSDHSIKNVRIKKSKLKQQKTLLSNKTEKEFDDDSSSDEKLKMVDKKDKDKFLKEMFEMLKREQFKLENFSFSNSISESIEPIRSLSADCLKNFDYDQFDSINFIDEYSKTKITHLSENDLNKLKDFDNRSVITLKTELLNLDLIDKELLDRDQLENITFDNEMEIESNKNQQLNLIDKLNRMNIMNYRTKLNSKYGLADLNINQKRKSNLMVTKTNKKDNLNKRTLVNNWLSKTKDQKIFYEEDFNQLNSFLPDNHSQFLNFNNNNCVDIDCKLCKLNEEQINELDSDVLQLINILKTLDEILYEKEQQLQKLAIQAEQSPSHSNLCATKKKKLIKSKANLMKKVNMLKQRGSRERLGISMLKTEQGKQLITFRDGKSTYHIEIGECE